VENRLALGWHHCDDGQQRQYCSPHTHCVLSRTLWVHSRLAKQELTRKEVCAVSDLIDIALKFANDEKLSKQDWILLGSTAFVLLKQLADKVNVNVSTAPLNTKRTPRKKWISNWAIQLRPPCRKTGRPRHHTEQVCENAPFRRLNAAEGLIKWGNSRVISSRTNYLILADTHACV